MFMKKHKNHYCGCGFMIFGLKVLFKGYSSATRHSYPVVFICVARVEDNSMFIGNSLDIQKLQAAQSAAINAAFLASYGISLVLFVNEAGYFWLKFQYCSESLLWSSIACCVFTDVALLELSYQFSNISSPKSFRCIDWSCCVRQ